MTLSNKEISLSWRANELLMDNKEFAGFTPFSWLDGEAGAGFEKWEALDSEISKSAKEIDALTETPEPPEEDLDTINKDESEPEILTVSMAVFDQAKRDYFENGYLRGSEEAEQKWEDTKKTFSALTQSIYQEQKKATTFFEPLKTLSVHIAKQLVRGELSLSSAAIERLIRGVLEDIQQKGPSPLVMNLNPQDLEKIRSNMAKDLAHLDLRGDDNLSPGSVVLTLDNSAIEDLIEHRLDVLSDSLFSPDSADSVSVSNANKELPEKEKNDSQPQVSNSHLDNEPQKPSDEADDG